ncbi:MAG TPA: choice-of-anchor Q domain-containing protein [Mycobacteriales bacterium]|nr:choice-of-anchor Q domain-containing protein [Mycobacteriales bacterium]
MTTVIGGVGVPGARGATTTVRYASPAGTGTDCTSAEPCSLVTAVNDGPSEAPIEVRIRPGTYGSAAHPLTTGLTPIGMPETVHGTVNTSPPTIYIGGTSNGLDASADQTIENLSLVYSGSAVGFATESSGMTISRVSVIATTDNGIACELLPSAELTDSLCDASGKDGVGIFTFLPPLASGETATATLVGDTAVAQGSGGIGIYATTAANDLLDVDATNLIAMGAADGVFLDNGNSGLSGAAMTASHSDLGKTSPSGADSGFTLDPTDITTAPKFVDPAHGNFQERPTSPTINKGAAESPTDTLDLLGHPRTIGPAPDMGAYELPAKPKVSKPAVVSLRQRAARMGCQVWAQDSLTTVRLIATHGTRTIRSKPRTLAATTKSKTVKLTISGLAPHTHYVIRAVARNGGGTVTSKSRRIKTKR